MIIMTFMVAIPSYNRAEELRDYSLKTLISKNVDAGAINIFVANEEEYLKYKKTLSTDNYNEIIITEKGKMNAINHIRRYYKKGQKLLNLDDDIMEVYATYNSYQYSIKNLNDYSEYMFRIMKKHKVGLCGLSISSNPFFRTNTASIDNHWLCGGLYWTINNPSPKLDLYCDNCEDLEFSLKNYEYYGGVMKNRECYVLDASLRANIIQDRLAVEQEMAKTRLKCYQQFPHLLKHNHSEYNGSYSIDVIHFPKKKKIIPLLEKKW